MSTEPFPYQLQYGYCSVFHLDFATFAEGLACLKGFRESDPDRDCRLVNINNIDGSDDAKPWAQLGLTEAEWGEVQGVESKGAITQQCGVCKTRHHANVGCPEPGAH